MLEQLSVARRMIEDGQEVVPAWRITTPEGTFHLHALRRCQARATRARNIFDQPVHGLENGHELRAYG